MILFICPLCVLLSVLCTGTSAIVCAALCMYCVPLLLCVLLSVLGTCATVRAAFCVGYL